MRVVLADLKSSRGFVGKDTIVGGYGSWLDPFSRVTSVVSYFKKQFHDVPSVHMAYVAAVLARAGHDVAWTRGDIVDGDVALVLSSLVDYHHETAWADQMRARQREIIEHCRKKGIVTAAFYVLGFLQDDWNSIAATIDYAVDLGSTFAQFKILTPYPGTPMFNELEPLLTEDDWEKFDGYTPTFEHPNLTPRELRFLIGAAYTRFYMRPSYLANFLKIQNTAVREWISRLDRRVNDLHSREEIADMSRPVAC